MRIATALAALVGVLMLGSFALAQEGEATGAERPARERPARDRSARVRGFRAEAYYQRLQRELDLTPAQQKQIKQMVDTHAQALTNWQKKQGDPAERRAKWRKAREERDEKAINELREQMSKAARERTALQNELSAKIKSVLNEKQKTQFEELVSRGRRVRVSQARQIRAALGQMDLTAAEKSATEAIVKKTEKAVEGKRGRERAELWTGAVEDVKKVLGPAKAAKFEKIRRDPAARARARAAFRGITLTEEQVDKIIKIQADYREKLNSVLTEEQKAKFKTLQAEREGRMRRFRERGGRVRERGGRARERGPRERARPRAAESD